jgi:2-oxoglutarate ferredoxin oxidoreductase subunit beta
MTTTNTENMQVIYQHPEAYWTLPPITCPGCTHGVAHRLVAEVWMRELAPEHHRSCSVGCSDFTYLIISISTLSRHRMSCASHGTGIKRVHPDRIVLTYQGDGDMISIGTGEITHAAARGENITVIFINNANYGMTGGQMAPTTCQGRKTTSRPKDATSNKLVILFVPASMLATLDGAGYIARRSLHDPKNIRLAKKAIRTAFENSGARARFFQWWTAFHLPTNWHLSPVDATIGWKKI